MTKSDGGVRLQMAGLSCSVSLFFSLDGTAICIISRRNQHLVSIGCIRKVDSVKVICR